MTELAKLEKAELETKIENMDIELLFAELEDTVQFDIAKQSTSEFLSSQKDWKVYRCIVNELKRRVGLYG